MNMGKLLGGGHFSHFLEQYLAMGMHIFYNSKWLFPMYFLFVCLGVRGGGEWRQVDFSTPGHIPVVYFHTSQH